MRKPSRMLVTFSTIDGEARQIKVSQSVALEICRLVSCGATVVTEKNRDVLAALNRAGLRILAGQCEGPHIGGSILATIDSRIAVGMPRFSSS